MNSLIGHLSIDLFYFCFRMRTLYVARLLNSRLARSGTKSLLASNGLMPSAVVENVCNCKSAISWKPVRPFSMASQTLLSGGKQRLFDTEYKIDEWTNLTENIKSKLNRNLLQTKYHPLNHLVNKIKYFFYQNYTSRMGSPIFSIYDNFKPIVTTEQNFDR